MQLEVVRQRLAFAAFVLIAALSIDLTPLRSTIFRVPTPDAVRADMVAAPWTGYDEFLNSVRQHTRRGDSIAIVVPPRSWSDGYEYGYRRAVYVLTGRTVLPLLAPDDAVLLKNLEVASHVAVWRDGLPDLRRRVLWAGRDGELLGPRR